MAADTAPSFLRPSNCLATLSVSTRKACSAAGRPRPKRPAAASSCRGDADQRLKSDTLGHIENTRTRCQTQGGVLLRHMMPKGRCSWSAVKHPHASRTDVSYVKLCQCAHLQVPHGQGTVRGGRPGPAAQHRQQRAGVGKQEQRPRALRRLLTSHCTAGLLLLLRLWRSRRRAALPAC